MRHGNGEDSQEYHYEIRSFAAIEETLQNVEVETVPGCRSDLKVKTVAGCRKETKPQVGQTPCG